MRARPTPGRARRGRRPGRGTEHGSGPRHRRRRQPAPQHHHPHLRHHHGRRERTLRGPAGPDGRYRQRVPEGIYGLRAEFRHTDAAGRPILLVLHPADGVTGQRHDSAEGIRKDFEWRISGLKPGQAAGEPGRHDEWGKYYGGSLQVSIAAERSDAPAAFPDGSVLTLTLTPRGPLLDGRPANPLTYERTFGCGVSAGSYWYPADIPLGTYDLAARLRTPDGADRPLPLRPSLGSHDFAPSVTLDVLPAADGSVLPIQITVLP